MGGCLVEAASVGEPGRPCAARWAEVGCGPPAGSGGWAPAVAGGPGTTERGVAHSDTCGLQPHFPPPRLSRGSGKLGVLPLRGSQSAGLPALLPPSARPWAATCRLQPRNGPGPGGCHQHGLEGGHPGQSSVLPARLLRGLRLKEAPKAPIWGTGVGGCVGGGMAWARASSSSLAGLPVAGQLLLGETGSLVLEEFTLDRSLGSCLV